MSSKRTRSILWGLGIIVFGVFLYKIWPVIGFKSISYGNTGESNTQIKSEESDQTTPAASSLAQPDGSTPLPAPVAQTPVTHIPTPAAVKAIYISSWVAGSPSYRDPLIKMVDNTELNAVVVDVKDSTGRISFPVSDPVIAQYGSAQKRISNINALVTMLHQKHIYIIGRIAVFQDPYMTHLKPEWSITKLSDGTVWKDNKGLSFLDPANEQVHQYIIALAKEAYADGFDEINFDYIRYPSDGNLKDINYHLTAGKTRADTIESFFKDLNAGVKKGENIPMSGDLFGLTTEAQDDMGIGQVWEKAFPYFDYLDPMIYPSHYAPGYNGYKNPALYPTEVITRSLKGAIAKTKAINGDINKIRPWLQDFSLGAIYDAAKVRDQITATNNLGLSSWLFWDSANKYTPSAFTLDSNQ